MIRKANFKGESKKVLSLVTNDMVEHFWTHKECQDKIKKLYDYGITSPVIRVSVKPFKENGRKEVFRRVIEALKNWITTQVIVVAFHILCNNNIISFLLIYHSTW